MNHSNITHKLIALALLLLAIDAHAAIDIVQQWKQGLKGAKLVSYSGSVISSNSSLTTIQFCHDGISYRYYREGSWSVPGQAGGTSHNTITGRWDIQLQNNATALTYITDQGQSGAFPIYLQTNGKVNIGGAAYSVQKGAAEC
jgi:hypothetical protein